MPLSTVAPATFNTTNTLGVDVTETFAVPTSVATQSQLSYPQSDYANPKFAPGQIVMGGNASTYVWSQVSSVGSINKGDFVAFLASISSTFTVQQLTSANAALGARIGISQVAQPVTTSILTQFCWIMTSGDGIGNVIGSVVTTNGVPLFVSSIAGALTSTTTTAFMVANVVNASSVAGTVTGATNVNIVANPMMVVQATSVAGAWIGPF